MNDQNALIQVLQAVDHRLTSSDEAGLRCAAGAHAMRLASILAVLVMDDISDLNPSAVKEAGEAAVEFVLKMLKERYHPSRN